MKDELNDPREGDFVWSTNDEDFRHDSLAEAMEQLECDDELEIGRVVYYGEKSTSAADSFMPSADHILDIAGDIAYDNGGEHAEDFGRDVTAEAKKELSDFLKAWALKHLSVPFYQVHNVKEYTITAEDLQP